MISSVHNPKVQWVKALQKEASLRREERSLVVEGVRLAEEALAAGWEIRLAWYTADLDARGIRIVHRLQQDSQPVEEVSPRVLQAISDTETPQGILLVVKIPEQKHADRLDLVFLPDQIRDPGNLGTMLRTAAAAGVDLLLLPPNTVDVTSPKVVRAAMGAHFRLPWRQCSWHEIQELVIQQGLEVFLADVEG
ncbi:MAG: TrmH family RNA methyltransferase, partial [Anaerolineales bacterium]